MMTVVTVACEIFAVFAAFSLTVTMTVVFVRGISRGYFVGICKPEFGFDSGSVRIW